jgi:Fanconi anemia group D2 protein
MPPEAQRDAISFLPEVAPEDDYPAVLDALEALVEDGPEFLIIVIDTASNLALNDAGQARIMAMVASRLQSVDVEDLPAVVRYLLQGAAMSSTNTLSTLRTSMHFVTPVDPRLAVPDRKGKSKVPAPGEDPESRVLGAMRQALQFGKGAADAVLKALKAVNTPAQHTIFDFWTLLTLASLNPDRKRVVHSMMRQKFADGHADASWLERSINGHAVALEEQFSPIMALAQHLLSDSTPAVSEAGAALFVTMFTEFSDAYCRQEVLRALHTHLGATATAEATAALRVLQRLAHERTSDLIQYAAFLTTILDYVAGYNAEQLAAAFDVFAELVAGACRTNVADGGGCTTLSQGGATAAAIAGGGRSRMEDELFIFLRKQLSGAFPAHRRVGSVGVVALVQRLGKEIEEHGDIETSLLSIRYREARALLDSTLTAAASCPDTLAFLCDALATEAQRGTLPKSLMEYLRSMLQDRLESQFIKSASEWTGSGASTGAGKEIWWDANGAGDEDDVVVALLPPANTAGARGGTSTSHSTASGNAGSLATLFPTLHAVAALNMAMDGNLASIDALLGCSMGLFTMTNVSPRKYATLDPVSQHQVLHGLFFGLNWCRELVNAFGPVAGAPLSRGSTVSANRMARQMQSALMLRVRAASQMEAALAALLPMAPPMTVLPSLGPAAASNDTTTAARRKPSAAGGAKKSAKVQFKDGTKRSSAGTKSKNGGGGDSTGTVAPQGSDQQERSRSSGSGGTGMSGGGPGTSSTAALLAKLTNEITLPVPERSKMRVLVPGAITALTAIQRVEGNDGMCFSSLPAAAYLLSDVVDKARISLAPPRKSPFLNPFGHKSASATMATAVSALELLGMLCPAMPALRDHLDNANRITESTMSDKDISIDEERVLKEYFTSSASKLLEILPDCPAAKRASSPTSAATRVFSGVLECVRLLLSYHEITVDTRRPALQAILSAFSPKSSTTVAAAAAATPASGRTSASSDGSFVTSQWTSQQYLEACINAFKYFLQLTPGDAEEDGPTGNEMARWPAVLAVLEALLKVGEKLAADATLTNENKTIANWSKRLSVMRRKLSESASLMLKQRWPSSGGNGGGDNEAFDEEGMLEALYNDRAAEAPAGGWKGRAAPLSEAIRLSIIYSTEPLRKVEEYINEGLAEVDGAPTGKINSEPLEDLPSLSGVTIGIWYKCLWEVLQTQWKEISAAAKSSSKAANAAPGAAVAIAAGVSACCAAFNSVVNVVKLHERRSLLLNAAAKGGGIFIEGVLRVLPFWKEVFDDHKEQVIESVRFLFSIFISILVSIAVQLIINSR